MSHNVEIDAWENGPCDCADCTTGPDTWCCRYCHSLAVGRVIPPEVTQ